ncbi:hypothetical protein IFR05_005833, partial [Cadophora sp. M221]
GIPGGYVGALETRLKETEIALYKSICSLRSSSSTTNSALDHTRSSSEPLPEALLQHEQGNESKVSKMATWKRLPLSTSEDVQSWWEVLRAESGIVGSDQVHGQLETSSLGYRDVPHVETSGDVSFEPENGMVEDPNGNGIPQGEQSQSHIPMQNPPESNQHVPWSNTSEIGMTVFRADDTGQHSIRSSSLIETPVSWERTSRQANQQNSLEEGTSEMGRPQRLSAMMSHIYY